MTSPEVDGLFAQAHAATPRALAHVLDHPEVIPPWFRDDIHTAPAQLVGLNARLRADGFVSEPWPNAFIALGEDPGGNVYFTDARDQRFPVYLAVREIAYPGCLAELGCVELWGNSIEAFLETLRTRDREIEEGSPFAVFSVGSAEVENLQRHPDADSLEQLFRARALPYCALTPSQRERIQASLYGGVAGWSALKGETAFILLDSAIEIAIQQPTPCLLAAALDLMAQLAQAAETSQMPAALENNWARLKDIVISNDLEHSESWTELTRQYHRT